MLTSCPQCGAAAFTAEPTLGIYESRCRHCGAELSPTPHTEPTAWALAKTEAERLACPIDLDLDLSVRTVQSLHRMGIYTVGDLVACSARQIIDGALNPATILGDIEPLLHSRGLQLATDADSSQ